MATKKKISRKAAVIAEPSASVTEEKEPTKQAKPKSKAAKKPKEEADKQPTFNYDLFRSDMQAASIRPIVGSDGKPTKKKEMTLDILLADSPNIIGQFCGVLSSRSVAIDKATGIGGIPRGRIIEVAGNPDTGKTTLLASLMAEAQRVGGVAALCDVEHKWDMGYAKRLGVDTSGENFIIIQPTRKTFESVTDAIFATLDWWDAQQLSHIPLVVGWDSVGQTPSNSEYAKKMDEANVVAEAAKLLKGAFRTMSERVAKSKAILLCINHMITNIQTRGGFRGPTKITAGGVALRYAASLRMELVFTGKIVGTDDLYVGSQSLIKVVKNNVSLDGVNVAATNQEAGLFWGRGFDNAYPLYRKLAEHKYITHGGGWSTFAVDDGSEPVRFQKTFMGFGLKLQEDNDLLTRCVEIYNALP